MTNLQHWIDRCCRRLNRGVVLKVTAEWLAVWLCAFGTLLLVTKVAWPALWPHVLWLGLSLVPVVGFAVQRAFRDRYSSTDGAALLDRRMNAGGLLMAVAERPNGRWRQQLPQEEAVWSLALPTVRPVRFARVVALPLAFAVVALLLPARQIPTSAATSGGTLPAVQELPEMLAELKQAEVLDADEAAFLQEEIDKLVESTSKAPPTPETWRKIDALRARLNDRLDRETRTIEKGRRAAEKLANAGKNGVPPLTKEQRRQLEKDLADALKRTRQAKKSATAKAAKPGAAAKSKTPPQPKGKKLPETKTFAKTAGASPGKKTPTPMPKIEQQPGKSPGKKAGAKSTDGKTSTKSPADGAQPVKLPSGKSKKKQSPAGKLPKQDSKSSKKQEPSGKKLPGFDPSSLRDLAKVAKMVENLPPEMQEKLRQEVMRMIRSGRIEIPQDPAVREMLMKQARQMLEQDGRRLEELRKRFGHLAGDPEQWKKLAPSSPTPRDSPSAGKTGNGAGADKTAGKQSGSSGERTRGSASFRDVVLPPGLLDKPRTDPDSVSGRRPTVAPFQPSDPPGPKTVDDPAGARWRALRRKVRPRNRELVYKYFYGKDGEER
jgi:hypothetical protein